MKEIGPSKEECNECGYADIPVATEMCEPCHRYFDIIQGKIVQRKIHSITGKILIQGDK